MAMWARIASFGRNRSGAVSVEFAAAAAFLAICLVALADHGMMAYRSLALEAAARSGANYLMMRPGDPDGLRNMVRATLTLAPEAVNVEGVMRCECLNGAMVDCSGNCAGSGPDRIFAVVTVLYDYTPIFAYPWLGERVALRGRAEFRVR